MFLRIQLYLIIKMTVSTLKKEHDWFHFKPLFMLISIFIDHNNFLADALVFVLFWKVCSRYSNINELASQRKKGYLCVCVCVQLRERERELSLPDKLFAKRKGCHMHLKLATTLYKVKLHSLLLPTWRLAPSFSFDL